MAFNMPTGHSEYQVAIWPQQVFSQSLEEHIHTLSHIKIQRSILLEQHTYVTSISFYIFTVHKRPNNIIN